MREKDEKKKVELVVSELLWVLENIDRKQGARILYYYKCEWVRQSEREREKVAVRETSPYQSNKC